MALRSLFVFGDVLCTNYTLHRNCVHYKHLKNILNKDTFRRTNKDFIGRKTKREIEIGNNNSDAVSIGSLFKPLCFTAAFSAASFAGATIWQYETLRSHAQKMFKRSIGFFNSQQKKLEQAQQDLKSLWNMLREDEKLLFPIYLANVIVFIAWRIPRIQPTMVKYFCSNPASKVVCWPMILSTFSHFSFFHLLANMYVLHSFSYGAVQALGREQFLGLYLSAGVISTFASYVGKFATGKPGLSLGASGAIMAILGYVCWQYPDTKLSIIFLPMWTFSAGSAIQVILGLDVLGVIMGWKFFDHAAHLGGAAFGIMWSAYGNEHIWQKRDCFLQYWHKMRGVPSR